MGRQLQSYLFAPYPGQYSSRRRRKPVPRDQAPEGAEIREPTLEEVINPEHLIATFKRLSRRGGQAPGPDNVRYSDLGPREIGIAGRGIANFVRDGWWIAGPARRKAIPKANGGTRTLLLRSIYTRVLSSALLTKLEPMFRNCYLPGAYCRSPLGHLRMLAAVKVRMEREQRWVLAQDDVRTAFDSIRISKAMDCFRRHVQGPELLQLIEDVLRAKEHYTDPGREVGIDQGSALSGLAMHLILHYTHDLPLTEAAHLPWYRYADNLVYLCQSMPEGQHAMQEARRLLRPARLTLKHQDQPTDLQTGATTHLLGFELSHHNGELRLSPGSDAWTSLEQSLCGAHTRSDPTRTASTAVEGWLTALAPSLENADRELLPRITRIATQCGFRELGNGSRLHAVCSRAISGWEGLVTEALRG